MHHMFHRISVQVSQRVGSPTAFVAALFLILLWLITGPLFDFSDTWQLVVNTATTIITFLMVFLVQNTQNREALATQLKLDELIRAVKEARNEIVDLEEASEEELQARLTEFREIAAASKKEKKP